jgi:hypothetical protein
MVVHALRRGGGLVASTTGTSGMRFITVLRSSRGVIAKKKKSQYYCNNGRDGGDTATMPCCHDVDSSPVVWCDIFYRKMRFCQATKIQPRTQT